MRYQMGCVELIGWMILGGFLGVVLLAVATNGLSLLLTAHGLHPVPLDLGGGLLVFFLSIVIGAAIPVVIFCRGKWE
jgi:hypothetical protein